MSATVGTSTKCTSILPQRRLPNEMYFNIQTDPKQCNKVRVRLTEAHWKEILPDPRMCRVVLLE